MDGLKQWMEDTAINNFVTGNAWAWPMLETFHFIGLCLLLGSLLIVDLRIMGFSKKVPIGPVHSFVPITIIGFSINFITGLLFLFGDPHRYFPNVAFQLKMVLIVLAGLNVLYFESVVHPKIKKTGDATIIGMDAKFVAGASLALWVCVIIAGRMIPYVE